jgi:hypothetical protein
MASSLCALNSAQQAESDMARTFVCLSSVCLIYDPVSSKTSCFKNRIRECVKLCSLFRYCAQLTDGYCMVVC